MKIVISAVNLIEGGPLTILQNCLESLSEYATWNNIKVYALVHNKDLCLYPHINYIEIPWAKNNWFNRMYCEYFYLKKLSEQINPDLWLSLHDITPNVNARIRAVYCHNPTPFYRPSLSDMKYNYKEFLFSLFYRYFYQINIKKNAYVIVQQNWLRDSFSKMFNLDAKKVIVALPNHKDVLENHIKHREHDICTFFYPAFPRTFKNFEVICKACSILEEEGVDRFRVVLTLKGIENKYAQDIFNTYSHLKRIEFCGLLSREKVLDFYRETDCLLFPSKLETWGLPISEFMNYEKPMLISDLPYAYETAAGAKYVNFFNPSSPDKLAQKMKDVINHKTSEFKQVPLLNIEDPITTSWVDLFDKLLKTNA